MTLSHVDETGRPRMVDVSAKPATARRAVAGGVITMSRQAFGAVEGNTTPKGNVLTTAEIAGTLAAKRTAELIPLCHPLPLDQIVVRATLDADLPAYASARRPRPPREPGSRWRR